MAFKIGESTLPYHTIEQDDIIKYVFTINGLDLTFSIVRFDSVEEFNSYAEDESEMILSPFKEEELHHIVGYDWDFDDELLHRNQINIVTLVKIIYEIGARYILEREPDLVFYFADNPKLHRIYHKMFPYVGWEMVYSSSDYYFYSKCGKEIIKIIDRNK